jgi:hypothetical protein
VPDVADVPVPGFAAPELSVSGSMVSVMGIRSQDKKARRDRRKAKRRGKVGGKSGTARSDRRVVPVVSMAESPGVASTGEMAGRGIEISDVDDCYDDDGGLFDDDDDLFDDDDGYDDELTLTLGIELLWPDGSPRQWRRLEVPDWMRLTGLAAVIQALFGRPAIGEYEFIDGDGQFLTPLDSAPDGLIGLAQRGGFAADLMSVSMMRSVGDAVIAYTHRYDGEVERYRVVLETVWGERSSYVPMLLIDGGPDALDIDGVNDRLIELYLNDERGWGTPGVP